MNYPNNVRLNEKGLYGVEINKKIYISISKIVFNSDLQSIHMEYCFFLPRLKTC